jgi:anti-anti-sigma factor
MAELKITTSWPRPTACLIAVEGELDLDGASRFEDTLQLAIEGQATSVLVDLADCDFIDSSTIAVLARANAAATNGAAADFAIISPHPHIRRVFEITHLDHVFSIYPDADTVLQADSALVPGHEASDHARLVERE